MFVASILVLLVCVTAPANAQLFGTEGSAVKEGFTLPADKAVKILVFRPDVQVAEQTTGGLDQPNADWTQQAKSLLNDALVAAQARGGNDVIFMPALQGEQARLMADHQALFRVIADAAITHKLFPGDELPSKKGKFDWTLGPTVQELSTIGGGADYGLFLYSYDSYGSSGRKAAQIVGLILAADLIPAGVHIGYAALVDLKNGDLVWINADISMGGDVRTQEGAEKRVMQLLEDFPVRSPVQSRRGDVTVGGAP
ncbi:hypothetical protein ACFOWX_05865 [Sphingorhabdus arenilitoris]|uniref:DUF2066 domain-containing protein n=1 Tax=Sphingorhabdus arenilitoris TaxID=1490041 RepID=A0ABV8RFB5_9SPHN